MKKLIAYTFCYFAFQQLATAAIRPETGETYRLYGGNGEDGGYNIRTTRDGGFIIAGNTADENGNRDMLLLKLRPDLKLDERFGNRGRLRIGGSGEDQAADVLEIFDSMTKATSYLLVGQSDSTDGDFDGLSHRGKIDTVLVMLDESGNFERSFGEKNTGIRFYGTSEDDEPIVHRHNYSEPGERIVEADDGFIISSHARASDGDLEGISINGIHSGRDVFIFKIDKQGDFVESWADQGVFLLGSNVGSQDRQKENANDFIFSIQLDLNGYLIGGGYTLGKDISLDGDRVLTIGNLDHQGADDAHGDVLLYKMDGMVIRLTPEGGLDDSWGSKGVVFLGGTRQEKMYDVDTDQLGRYLITGRTTSYDLQMHRKKGLESGFDMVVCRLMPDGMLDKSFGDSGKLIIAGKGDDQALRISVREDGSIVFLGQSTSTDGHFALPGYLDLYRQAVIGVLNDDGEIDRVYSLGLEGEDKPSSFVITDEARIVITGFRLPFVNYEYDKEDPEILKRRLWVHAFDSNERF